MIIKFYIFVLSSILDIMHFQYANNIHVLKPSEFIFFIYRLAHTQIKRNVTVVFPFYYSDK